MVFSVKPKQAAREVQSAGPATKRSLFWPEIDKAGDKNESLSESYERNENVDDDNDETVPHWFRQLDQHSSEPAIEEFENSNNPEVGYLPVFNPFDNFTTA